MLRFTSRIDTEAVLWRLYWHGRGESAFNRLVTFYLPWVEKLAHKHAACLPEHVDWHDLYQDGSMALLNCIQRYEKGHGTKFTSYAKRRITGSFTDGLRERDWVPRLVRQRKETPVTMRPFKPVYNDAGEEKQETFATRDRQLASLEMRDEVRHALRGIGGKQRLAVLLYYTGTLNMREIGESLGISEPRVSQIIGHAIRFLRARKVTPTSD